MKVRKCFKVDECISSRDEMVSDENARKFCSHVVSLSRDRGHVESMLEELFG